MISKIYRIIGGITEIRHIKGLEYKKFTESYLCSQSTFGRGEER